MARIAWILVAAAAALVALATVFHAGGSPDAADCPMVPAGASPWLAVPMQLWGQAKGLFLPTERIFTVEELRLHDGSDPSKPLLLAVGGIVFDVSAGAKHYGKDAPYNCFAGIDATRALALGSLDEKDRTADLSGLSETQLKAVQEQVDFYTDKYVRVGMLSVSAGGSVSDAPATAAASDQPTADEL